MKNQQLGCRPLVKNYGPPKVGETIEQCRKCGADCIGRPRHEAEAKRIYPNIKFVCTKCAITMSYEHPPEPEV